MLSQVVTALHPAQGLAEMGYNTRYHLDCDQPGLIEALVAGDEELSYAIDEDGSPANECKWYEHEDDMKKISRKHPGIVFALKGEGEESGDVWMKYFRDGKVQVCETIIAFDAFDPKKLV